MSHKCYRGLFTPRALHS